MARCPECNARLKLPEELELWDHVFCTVCDAELEVVGFNPLELEVVEDLNSEDVDDEDMDFDEDDVDWEDFEDSEEEDEEW